MGKLPWQNINIIVYVTNQIILNNWITQSHLELKFFKNDETI